MDMPFPGEGVWLVNWLGNWVLEGGHWGVYPKVVYIHTHMHDRLDKSCSALAEVRLTIHKRSKKKSLLRSHSISVNEP